MTPDEIVLLARKADLWITSDERWAAVVRFANLVVAAERNKVELEWQTQKPVAWIYPEALEAFEKGDPWVAYGGNGDGLYPDGVQRIPLYLNNDAIASRAEPRLRESGAGFESLPASPTTEQNV